MRRTLSRPMVAILIGVCVCVPLLVLVTADTSSALPDPSLLLTPLHSTDASDASAAASAPEAPAAAAVESPTHEHAVSGSVDDDSGSDSKEAAAAPKEYAPASEAAVVERANPRNWLAGPWYTSSLMGQRDELELLSEPLFNTRANPFSMVDNLTMFEPFASRLADVAPFLAAPAHDYTYERVLSNGTRLAASGVLRVKATRHPACELRTGARANDAVSYVSPVRYMRCRKYPWSVTSTRKSAFLSWDDGHYNVVRNVVWWNGDLYSADNETKHLDFMGQVMTLRLLNFQPSENELVIPPLPSNVTIRRDKYQAVGVYQPLADWATMWHTLSEQMMPMFHAALPFFLGGQKVAVFQPPPSRKRDWSLGYYRMPKKVRRKNKGKHSCMNAGKKCMDTTFGRVLLNNVAKSGFYMDEAYDYAVPVGAMLVGNPGTCIPAWGAEGAVLSSVGMVSPECAKLMFLWRAYFLKEFDIPYPSPHPLVMPAHQAVVLWGTRKGAWAREILNEDSVIRLIRERNVTVKVATFAQPLSAQYALLQQATHMVAPHGATLVHFAMLRPRSRAISIDVTWPPFSGTITEVPWIHRFHFRGTLACNPKDPMNYKRMRKGRRCKVFRRSVKGSRRNTGLRSEHHNNIEIEEPAFMQMFDSTLLPLDAMRVKLANNITYHVPPTSNATRTPNVLSAA
eukprot:Rhum_TRINITY_DN11065_c1_g1::Rhum_TRINITY_DN11065_c1_g1_i1::g.42202::m.42202